MKLKFVLLLVCAAGALHAQIPEWIWFDAKDNTPAIEEVRYFRKNFDAPKDFRKAVLTASGDDRVTVFLNSKQVAESRNWKNPVSVDVTKEIQSGANVLALRGRNNNGSKAVIAKLEFTLSDGAKRSVVTDASWMAAPAEIAGWQDLAASADGWFKPVSRGKLGVEPWGDIMATPEATPAEKLTVLPGFKVERLRSAERGEGSWVCMAVDPKGRLIISPQEGTGNMLRVTLNKAGTIERLEKIDVPVGSAMGLLCAFDSLYVSGNGPDKLALYRIKDTDGDDHYDKVETLRRFDGAGGEHGSHALVLGPDNKIYYIHGNFVKVPADISPNSPHRNYAEDVLLPRQEDGNGFGVGNKPPGSFVLRMDKDAKQCELFASGMRNAYDIDFNADGELFTFDSDMEWDWGTPWYRPTRIYHVVSGGDYGFREGTAKYPDYYPDALPPAVDIGIGSPTGVKFGTKAKQFPAKYQRAFFAMDWSYGRILAVHLTPEGATYRGGFEPFIVGKPLNVTDLEFGQDGTMYFTTGGRGTQSGLYRVTYTGQMSAAAPGADKEAATARAIRRKLESYHSKQSEEALATAVKYLDNKDRWIRYAARIALESQPVDQWKELAVKQESKLGSLTALLALARLGPGGAQDEVGKALGKYWPDGFDDQEKLEALRICNLAFIRMGKPDEKTAQHIIDSVASMYPSNNARLNRELVQLLIYLQAPGVVQKTMDLVARSETQEEQLHYIFHLRTVKNGWTPEDRQKYFAWFKRDRSQDKHPAEVTKWFADVQRDYSDGASFPKFMANIKRDAVSTLTEAEKAQLADVISTDPGKAQPKTERKFVKEWSMADLVPALGDAGKGRNFRRGREAFSATQCILCHKFGTEGGSVGPDITGAASRFNRRDLLETIIEPSKVISDQYQNITVTKKDGDEVTGRLVEENDERVVLVVNPLSGDRVEIKKKEIGRRTPSKLSPMPEGLVNVLTKEEILDLLAYIEAAGKREHAAFAR
jgi:putative heme-binding domain-containing protein